MLSLTSVSASEVVIGNVADKFKLPCQRVHAVTVTVGRDIFGGVTSFVIRVVSLKKSYNVNAKAIGSA